MSPGFPRRRLGEGETVESAGLAGGALLQVMRPTIPGAC
jgi:hypothetical protein